MDRAPALDELQVRVFEALGAASTCWDDQGVFDSDHARSIGDALVFEIVRITGYGKYDTPESRDPIAVERWLRR